MIYIETFSYCEKFGPIDILAKFPNEFFFLNFLHQHVVLAIAKFHGQICHTSQSC